MSNIVVPDDVQDGGMNVFKRGKKPAILFLEGENGYKELEDKYPYVAFDKNGWKMRVFFQSSTQYNQFMNTLKEESLSINNFFEDEKRLGLLLGYPESAVETFLEDNPIAYGVIYHGLVFSTTPELVEENIKWLTNMYPVPSAYQTGVFVENEDGSKFVEIIGNDFSVLKDLEKSE